MTDCTFDSLGWNHDRHSDKRTIKMIQSTHFIQQQNIHTFLDVWQGNGTQHNTTAAWAQCLSVSMLFSCSCRGWHVCPTVYLLINTLPLQSCECDFMWSYSTVSCVVQFRKRLKSIQTINPRQRYRSTWLLYWQMLLFNTFTKSISVHICIVLSSRGETD